MDGELSIPRNLQTDRVCPAAPKRERRSGNPRRFSAELSSTGEPHDEREPEDHIARSSEEAQESSDAAGDASSAGRQLNFEA